MEEIIKKFEPISGINYVNWAFGMVLLIVISELFAMFFTKYGSTVSNRKLFSSIFLLFSISIYIIVSTIKSSLSLSLGLVGALSILRFRTAIKEPEQIVYLLALTGIAISLAAEQFIVTIIFAGIFLGYVRYRFKRLEKDKYYNTDYIVLDFQAKENKITELIDKILDNSFTTEIASIDNYTEGSYRVVVHSAYTDANVFNLKQELKQIDTSLRFNSFNLTAAIK